MTSKTRYEEMLVIYDDHPEYDDTHEENRKKIFEAYIEDLRVKEKEEARESRKQQMSKFKDIVSTLGITVTTTWKEFQVVYEGVLKTEPMLVQMDRMDLIVSFEDYILTLDSQHRQQRNLKQKAIRRQERLDRQEFYSMVLDMRKRGDFGLHTKWKSFHGQVKSDSRFIAILGNAGSSPLELFRDQIMELENLYLPDRRKIMDIVRSSRFEIGAETVLKDFLEHFKRDFRGIRDDNIKYAFEEASPTLILASI